MDGDPSSASSFAVLLPLTSRRAAPEQASAADGGTESWSVAEMEGRLCAFLDDLLNGTQGGEARGRVSVFVGIDQSDAVLASEPGPEMLERVLGGTGVEFEIKTFDLPPGSICRIWSDLAQRAFTRGKDFVVLLGDDVRVQTHDWMDRITAAFHSISASTFTSDGARPPFGFGVVAFNDRSCPNFPSFPVLHRLHHEIFPDGLFPPNFKNQDADPFLFAAYARFNAARWARDCVLTNEIGGYGDCRYTKQHVDWKGDLLDSFVAQIRSFIQQRGLQLGETPPALDVVVPTFRCDIEILKGICNLPVANDATTFHIIVDKPEEADRVEAELEAMPRVRVRSNPENLGASLARNRGLEESAAEWVLFLDDDVIPDRDLLLQYSRSITENRGRDDIRGFIGLVTFPDPPPTPHTKAVALSDVTYMFSIAGELERPYWGVTANLVIKRTKGLRLLPCFPKTGGGEDVDLCIRMNQEHGSASASSVFLSVPGARVTHPWWEGGRRGYGHFFRWAKGDGQLFDLHPSFTYRNWPNVAASMGFAAVGAALYASSLGRGGMGGRLARMLLWPLGVLEGEMMADVAKHMAIEPHRQPGLQGWRRVLAAAESTVVILCLELGRMEGHWSRGSLARNLCRRFDWFCGRLPGAVAHERRWAAGKFLMGHCLWGVVVQEWAQAASGARLAAGGGASQLGRAVVCGIIGLLHATVLAGLVFLRTSSGERGGRERAAA